jgi:hypothetical protein
MRLLVLALSACSLAACASVDMTPSAQISGVAGDGLTETKSTRARAAYRVDAPAVRAARTVRLEPVAFSDGAGSAITDRQREVLGQTLNQALCARVSRHFEVAPDGAPADLVLRAEITRLGATSAASSAVSTVAGFVSPVPFTPRLPIGLGSLVVEGVAADPQGQPRALLVWGRGADMFTTKPRASAIGDAFTLARAFGGDFAKLLTQAGDPFKSAGAPKRATRKPTDAECAAWGPGPGAAGFIGGRLGLPPEATAPRSSPPASNASP